MTHMRKKQQKHFIKLIISIKIVVTSIVWARGKIVHVNTKNIFTGVLLISEYGGVL